MVTSVRPFGWPSVPSSVVLRRASCAVCTAALEGFKAESGDRWTAAELCAAFSLGDVEARIQAELAADTSDRAKRCAETCRILRAFPPAWSRAGH